MEPQITTDYLIKADHWAADLAKEAAEKIAKADQLKEVGKDLLASIKCEIDQAMAGKHSQTALEDLARQTEKWREYRSGYFEANREAIIAKARAANAERHFHTIQSCLSYRKEELRRLDGERIS
jgi:hypothetical protein